MNEEVAKWIPDMEYFKGSEKDLHRWVILFLFVTKCKGIQQLVCENHCSKTPAEEVCFECRNFFIFGSQKRE